MAVADNKQEVGEHFVAALGRRDFAAIEQDLDPAVRFRALIPPGLCEASDAATTVSHLREWFGGADELIVVATEADRVADRLRLTYRLRLRDADGWHLVEQQAYCDVAGRRIAGLDLLCSGFRREDAPVAGSGASLPAGPVPHVDALLDAPGEGCATLTPMIRNRIRELASGAVLAVRTDDPAAHEGVPAWCRLTGNELLAVVAGDGQPTTFYLRAK